MMQLDDPLVDLGNKRILCYHKVEDVNTFESHLKLISKRNDVLVTFDDGHHSFYSRAFPLLKKYKVPAVLFIISGLVDTDNPFWWDEISYYLPPHEARTKKAEVKTWPNSKRLQYLEELRKKSDKPLLKAQQLTRVQLVEMQNGGIVIGNHSHTHPMFDRCSEEFLKEELAASKLFFQETGLKGFQYFAYPNGNHNELAEKVLSAMGIQYAFLFDHKISAKPLNKLRISRLSVNDYTPLWKLRLILSGWHSILLPLRKKLTRVLR